MEQVPRFSGAKTNTLTLEQPKTYHLPDWDGYKDPKKLAILRDIVMQYGRDPRIAQLAVEICRQAGCKPREYEKQAACLLKWVQTEIYYVNEPGERLQSPLYTLKTRMGDCDDMVILLCSFYECLRLDWKLVISANTENGIERYHEGDVDFRPLPFSHIYCMVGDRPFTPSKWHYCEPTLNVPFGWDIGQAQSDPEARKHLPELAGVTTATIAGSVAEAAGSAEQEGTLTKYGKQILVAVIVGSMTAVATEMMLEYIRTSPQYKAWRKGRKIAK